MISHNGPGKVHLGIATALDFVWDSFKDRISADRPLFITGHSLGGGLATLAAARLSQGRDVHGVYTFGSPRVGDSEFAQQFQTEAPAAMLLKVAAINP